MGVISLTGWSLGEHGEWAKYSNFDVATRIPLMFYVAGVTAVRPWPETFPYINVFGPTPHRFTRGILYTPIVNN